MKIELGLTSFADNSAIHMPEGSELPISNAQRIRNIVEEIELADQLGLDIYGLGEHHRKDYAVSDPVTVLAAAAVLHISNYHQLLLFYHLMTQSEYMSASLH